MILYIAEKPSLGRAIAGALPGPQQKQEGYIRVGDGAVVSWCVGHMLEQAEPEAYDPAFKRWCHEHLPIVPDKWQLVEKRQTRKQLSVLRRLVKQADTIVHAGDPDREGQLLVDEVIHHLGRQPMDVQRLLINDLNRDAVRIALGQLRHNREFAALSTSALARSRADWLYGINLTRAYTLQGRKVNYRGVLSVGRVQTPVLGLVVRRDAEIEAFVSKPFFDVKAEVCTDAQEHFDARWVPSEACARFLDSEGRNLSRSLAENVAGRITDKPARVTQVERKRKRSRPPLPHSLSSLQIDAARQYRLSAQRVLDICQTLYEQHKLITYPRSDCRYLPTGHHTEAEAVVKAIETNPGGDRFSKVSASLDFRRRSGAWNDSKVGAHHAIIPTQGRARALSEDEARVYGLVCRNYLAQFLATHEYAETKVELDIEGGRFVCNARQDINPGWRELFTSNKSSAESNADRSDARAPTMALPALTQGQVLHCLDGKVVERHTSPPARFTDASLLSAMTGIAAFITDRDLKKTLRETDGLGTEATRAGIIELLFRRGFLVRISKHIESTPAGRGLINALPESATLPDRTARWEITLAAITERSASYDTLMLPLIREVGELVIESQRQLPQGLSGLGQAKPSSPRRRRRKAATSRAGGNAKRSAPRIKGAKGTKGTKGTSDTEAKDAKVAKRGRRIKSAERTK